MSQNTQIGIIEAGQPSKVVLETYGDFTQLLSVYFKAEDFRYTAFPVDTIEKFPDPKFCQAWIITGSPAGVNDDLPWINPLLQFIKDVVAAKVPLLGICFGHQAMAKALGGKVEKGIWQLGVQEFSLTSYGKTMLPNRDKIALSVSNKDHVVEMPDKSKLIAFSDSCPYAAISYSETALSFQAHPELSNDSIALSIKYRREIGILDQEFSEKCLATTERYKNDREELAPIFRHFLQTTS